MDQNNPNYQRNRKNKQIMTQSSSNFSNSPQNFPSNYPQNYPPNYQNYPQNYHTPPPYYPQNQFPNYHLNPQQNSHLNPQQNYHQNPPAFPTCTQNDFQTQPTCYLSDDNDSDHDIQDDGNNTHEVGGEDEFVPSTQPEDMPFVQPNTKQGGKYVEKKIWSKAEKEALISAYMNTSTDSIVGTQQKRGAFWARVHELYDQARESNPNGIAPRSRDSMKSQWTRINEAVQKWCGAFANAEGRRTSGQSDDDVIKEAHTIFERNGGKFHFFDEWKELRKFSKFEDLITNHGTGKQKGRSLKTTGVVDSSDSGSSGKRSRDDGDSSDPHTPTSGDVDEGHMPRPEGVKKAKSRLKGKFKAKDAYECIESFQDRLQLIGDQRTKKSDEHERRLKFMMEKEARKKQQMEMMNKQMQLDQYRMKWEMMTFLSNKENLTSQEQACLDEANEYVLNFKF